MDVSRRLDQLIVDRGLAESRSRARALIEAGLVRASGERQDKPGRLFPPGADLVVEGRDHPWVSRGGVKLAAALQHFGVDPTGAVALDIGASTGGFTDVLLAKGARLVHAIDVGSGQLAAKLRDDPRVVVRENCDARAISRVLVPEPLDIIMCDVSFIGLTQVLPAALALAAAGAHLIALIKPQFEVGPGKVGKRGIVRDPLQHDSVCRRIEAWLGDQPGWVVRGVIESPITGGGGNREFLICARLEP